MRTRLPLLLLCCGGLAMAAVDGGGAPPPAPTRPAADREAPAPTATAALLESPSGVWTEQVERPLFAPGRRPPAAASPLPAVEARPEPQPPVAANGVVLRPAGAVALLRLVDERVVRVAEGQEIEGWLVAGIDAEGVRLSRGDKLLHLPVRARSAGGVLHH